MKSYILSRNQALSDHAPAAIISFDKELVVTDWNPGAEALFSISLAEATGRKIVDLITLDFDFSQDSAILTRILAGEMVERPHVYRRSRDNRYLILRENYIPIHNKSGQVVGGVLFAISDSDKYRIEKLLQCTQDVAKIGVWTYDIVHKDFFASNQTLNILDATPTTCHDVISLSNCIHEPDQKIFRAAISNSLDFGSPGQLSTFSKNERRLDFTWQIESVAGQPIHLQGVVSDSSEQYSKLMDLEQKSYNLLLKSRLSTLGEISAGLAHELNGPLMVISGSCQQLEEAGAPQDEGFALVFSKCLNRINRASERMDKIIKGLRSYSRNASRDDFTPTRVKEIIEDTLVLCEAKYSDKNISVRVAAIPDDLMVSCHASEISLIILNLLSNAADARSFKTAGDSWVKIEVTKNDGFISIAVTDNGDGIPEKLREKIMEPFFTTKKVGKGTGLGLSLSKGIAKSHGGDLYLDMDSTSTRFVLRLPIIGPALKVV